MRKTPAIIFITLAFALCLSANALGQSARRSAGGARLPSSRGNSNTAERPLPAGWQLYRFGDNANGWSMIFPVQPVEQTEPFKTPGLGVSLVAHSYEAQTRAGYYVAMYLEWPTGVNAQALAEKREVLYEALWTETTKELQASLRENTKLKDIVVTPLAQRKVYVNGYEGRERDFLISPAKVRMRVIFTERRMYALAAIWLKEEFEDERNAFFDLFEIRPAR